jgi:hypothetical protein
MVAKNLPARAQSIQSSWSRTDIISLVKSYFVFTDPQLDAGVVANKQQLARLQQFIALSYEALRPTFTAGGAADWQEALTYLHSCPELISAAHCEIMLTVYINAKVELGSEHALCRLLLESTNVFCACCQEGTRTVHAALSNSKSLPLPQSAADQSSTISFRGPSKKQLARIRDEIMSAYYVREHRFMRQHYDRTEPHSNSTTIKLIIAVVVLVAANVYLYMSNNSDPDSPVTAFNILLDASVSLLQSIGNSIAEFDPMMVAVCGALLVAVPLAIKFVWR